MTKEEQLLLVDLSARLPHKVYVKVPKHISINPLRLYSIKQIYKSNFDLRRNTWICCFWNGTFAKIDEVKPYLRSMSSMTEEEMAEFKLLNAECDLMPTFNYIPVEHYRLFDWLNRNYFDYRGLIPKGLAIEVTKDNNPYKD